MKRCNKSLCRELIPENEKYCTKHKGHDQKDYNKQVRQSPTDKRYTDFYQSPLWRNLRRTKMSIQPMCEWCLQNNRYSKGQVIHHKVEVRDGKRGWELRADINNLETLCHECHNKHHKTAQRWKQA